MNKKSSSINLLALIVFLAIIGVILTVTITLFRASIPGKIAYTQTNTLVTASSIYPGPNETQTIAAIITFKAFGGATELARTRIPNTPIVLSTGIYEDEPVKHSGNLLGLDAQNGWSGFVDEYYVFLYAGALLSDSNQGVVCLVITMPSGPSFQQYLSPTKHGWLRVSSEQNNRLVLTAADGTVFYFDLPTRQFVESLTGIAPSVTPSPFTSPEQTGIPYPMPTRLVTEAP